MKPDHDPGVEELGAHETRLARKQGAVTSADEQELSAGVEARTSTVGARQDLQNRVFPDLFPIREKEYAQPGPVSNLPEKVSARQIADENEKFWENCGPAKSEESAPLLAGTRVAPVKGGRL